MRRLGGAQVSYSHFLKLLHAGRVFNLQIIGRGHMAVFGTSTHGSAHRMELGFAMHKTKMTGTFAPPRQFMQPIMLRPNYVYLPGDFFTQNEIWNHVYKYLPHKTGDGCARTAVCTLAKRYKVIQSDTSLSA